MSSIVSRRRAPRHARTFSREHAIASRVIRVRRRAGDAQSFALASTIAHATCRRTSRADGSDVSGVCAAPTAPVHVMLSREANRPLRRGSARAADARENAENGRQRAGRSGIRSLSSHSEAMRSATGAASCADETRHSQLPVPSPGTFMRALEPRPSRS